MNALVYPTDTPGLDAYIDGRIARFEAARVQSSLKLSARQRAVVIVFVVFMLASVVMWAVGFSAYQGEVNARIDGNCATIIKVRDALENVLDTATAPRSTKGVTDPGQYERILELNDQLADARREYLPAIAALRCG